MKKICLILLIVLSFTSLVSAVYQPTRPPEPNVPFPYDPNVVKYDILRAFQLHPSIHIFSYIKTVIEPDGQDVQLICTNPNVTISEPTVMLDPDPNNIMPDPNDPNNMIPGPGLLYTYVCTVYLYGPPGVVYSDFIVVDSDVTDPLTDERTDLYYRKNRKPIINQ